MRRRIQELARGQFNYQRPDLEFSVEKLEINVVAGQDHTGEFIIESTDQELLKGVIYTSNTRMECINAQFEGTKIKVRYQFHSDGLEEGNIQKGDFQIISNSGEYNLSFVVYISAKGIESSVGEIKRIHDLVKLARENWNEACQIFATIPFRNMIQKEDAQAALLYQGLYRQENISLALEEFLCGIHKKERISFSIEEEKQEFTSVEEDIQESFRIKKDSWGYVQIELQCDGRFVELEKSSVDGEDFIGSICRVSYLIRYEQLHAGKNYARIHLTSMNGSQNIELCVTKSEEQGKERAEYLSIQKEQTRLVRLYLDYRLKRIVTGEWCRESVKILDHLMSWKDKDLYRLMKAQCYLVNRQKQEAEWILDEFKRKMRDHTKTIEWAYYDYLSTLTEREPVFVNRMTAEIERLYVELGEPIELFWMLLFLREEYYHNHSRKLRALEKCVLDGCRSPYLYLEAYYILMEEPYLLNKLGEFEVRILNWARKQECLTKDVVGQIMTLALKETQFNSLVYTLLTGAYEKMPTEELLECICNYLIRFMRYGTRYFGWYEKAVLQELRITNLYEAYMMSLDGKTTLELPQVILMYFQYNNTLPFQRKSLLYVSVIVNQKKQPAVYSYYQKIIEDFALRQLQQRHIDDNLAIIYENLLEQGVLNQEIARDIADILYTCRFTCLEEDIRYVVVLQRKWKKNIVVPVVNHIAYFPLYTTDYCILLEDKDGRRKAAMDTCQLEKLMHPAHYIRKNINWAPERIPYLLHYFETGGMEKAVSNDRTDLLLKLAESDFISLQYRKEILEEFLQYCYENDAYDLGNIEISNSDLVLLSPRYRVMAVEILVEKQQYERAKEMLSGPDMEFLQSRRLLSLCSWMIEENGYQEEKELLAICRKVFKSGKYNEAVLRYLSLYYQGPTKEMVSLFQVAKEFQVETGELEERLLVQMLFTTEFVENTDEIYQSYRSHGGRKLVQEAYLSYYSYCSFVKNMLVPESVYQEVLELNQEQRINDVCKLALLRYLSEQVPLEGKMRKLAETLLSEFIEEGMYFAFYKKFDHEILVHYHLLDKVFAEYRTRPGNRVRICYQFPESDTSEYQKEEMTDVFEGIYVRPFVLFFGDKLPYYIEEEVDGRMDITESNAVQNSDGFNEEDESRYDLLNAMTMSQTLEDNDTLISLMEKYRYQEKLIGEFFKIM